MDLKSSQLWGTPATETARESGFPDIPGLCSEATGTLALVMQLSARTNSASNGTLRTVRLSPKKKPDAQKPGLPNLDIPAQVLTPNFQIPGSQSIQSTGKWGDRTVKFQKPLKSPILDSQAQSHFKAIECNFLTTLERFFYFPS